MGKPLTLNLTLGVLSTREARRETVSEFPVSHPDPSVWPRACPLSLTLILWEGLCTSLRLTPPT